MRYTRQNKILELIKSNTIETQEQLAQMLNAEGFNVTQATVSRDIKSLELIKQNINGKSCYAVPIKIENKTDKFAKIMKDTIVSITYSENMIVIKTLSGCAGPTAEAIDMISDPKVLGTLAGDNTIFVVVDGKENVEAVISEIKKVL